MRQLSLSFQTEEESLRCVLEQLSCKPLSVVITDNSTSMLSVKKKGKSFSVRIHRIFLSAGEDVLREVACFIKNNRIKTPLMRAFINDNKHLLKSKSGRKVKIRTQGNCHDLLDVYRSVNRDYFAGRVSAAVTWGSRAPRRAAARRTLGSYCVDNNLIRINPMLDSMRVPRYFLEFIVYHEMLHADMGIRINGSRRSVHSREFYKREKMFRYYDRAIAWEKKRL